MEEEATLKIIDTPGLNESGEQDLRHMVKMVKVLRDLRFITVCILCIKFDAKIDAQYKATIAYYKKLLPDLFEGNILIVLTNFATDKRSERMRKMQGIDVDRVIANTVAEVKREGLVTFAPHVFLIDCLPLDIDPDDRNRQQSESTRTSILDFIQKMMHQVDVKSLMVAKTDALKQRDTEEIKRIDGEIHGYNVRLKEANAKAERVLADIEATEKERSDVDQELQRLKEDLEDKDSLGLVTAAEWSLKKEWRFFQWQEEPVLCSSIWPIVDFTIWDNGHLKWQDMQSTSDHIQGRVAGEFSRGLYANVTAKTHKKFKYAEEIQKLNGSIREHEQKYTEFSEHLKCRHEEQKEHAHDIELLQIYISDKNQKKKLLSSKYMSLEEAEWRLSELCL